MAPDNSQASSATDAQLQTILARHIRAPRSIVPLLQDLQEHLGYLSPEAVTAVAHYAGLASHHVFGVATFFSQFRFRPPGRHCLKICEGTACHVRGSALLLDTIWRKLHVSPGETTVDREFSLERVMCVGSCALGPVVVADGVVCGRVNQRTLEKLLKNRATPQDTK